MPKEIAITLWSLVAASLLAFGLAAIVSSHHLYTKRPPQVAASSHLEPYFRKPGA